MADLSGIERYGVRKETLAELWESTKAILEDSQIENWEIVRDYAQEVLRYGRVFKAGVDSNPRSILGNWIGNTFHGSLDQSTIDRLADAYLEDGKTIVERYARTDEQLDDLAAPQRIQLERAMLELQGQFHRQVEQFLSEDDRQTLRISEPLIVEFRFNNGVSIWGRRSYF